MGVGKSRMGAASPDDHRIGCLSLLFMIIDLIAEGDVWSGRVRVTLLAKRFERFRGMSLIASQSTVWVGDVFAPTGHISAS